jgi:predicted small lipoprotein YifL
MLEKISKFLLVLLPILVKLRSTMKRIYTFIVLLGIVVSVALTGCEKPPGDTAPPADTNAPPAAPAAPSTN